MKFKKIKICILLISLIIILFFIYKVMIINNFMKVQNNLIKSNNYHVKINSENGNMTEVYYKDGNYIYKTITKDSSRIFYIVDDEKLLIMDLNGKKNVEKIEFIPNITIWPNQEYYVSNSFIGNVIIALRNSIKKKEYNGQKVYCFSDKNVTTIVSKENYYVLQTNNGNEINKYEIDLNVVLDSDLEKPDLAGYEKNFK